MRKLLISSLLLLAVSLPFAHLAHAQQDFKQADVYYNEACGGCNTYIFEKLIPYLEDNGLVVNTYDYVNEKQNRINMNEIQDRLAIPFAYQSHIMTFIDGGELVIGGHVPLTIVEDLFAANQLPENLVIYQDEMLEMGVNPDNIKYYVWQEGYAVEKYNLEEPISTYLQSWQSGDLKLDVSEQRNIWPLVLSTGLLDGVNPCAIAVLIFFIAFLFTLQSSIGRIFKFGLVYIAVIYLTYLGIGFGLFQAIIISGAPHLMAKIGAWLVIALGLIQLISSYSSGFPIRMQIPKFSEGSLKKWLTKATLPAVIIGAFLVGLCTFPCSGGIYVAIIGLLAMHSTFWQGFWYLLAYNVMFVLPLVILLLLAGNKYALGKVAKWQSKADKGLKFWSGIVMLALGIIILIWFV